MKIAFESGLLIPPVSTAIAVLTDHAVVRVDDIHYDDAKGMVEISLQRREITGFKQVIWEETQPVYGKALIKSLLIICQVEEMTIEVDERLVAERNSCFTALFGLKMDEHQLYLGSAEEASGKTLCQVFIKVKGISIELRDEELSF